MELDLVLRVVGSIALLLASGALAAEPLLAVTALSLGAATMAVARIDVPGAALFASLAWPATAVAATAYLFTLGRPRWAAGFLALALVAAALLAIADLGLVERVVDASQEATLVLLLGAAAILARQRKATLALALAAYPGVALGTSLLAFDLALADLLAAAALFAATLSWIFLAQRSWVGLAILALPLVGMLAWGPGGDHGAGGVARLASAVLLVAAIPLGWEWRR